MLLDSVLMASASSLVMLLGGSRAVFSILATSLRRAAFCPWSGILSHASSVARMKSYVPPQLVCVSINYSSNVFVLVTFSFCFHPV